MGREIKGPNNLYYFGSKMDSRRSEYFIFVVSLLLTRKISDIN